MKKTINSIVLASFAILFSHSASAAFNECRDYFPSTGVPKVQPKAKLRELCFDSFAVLHSGETKTPVYTIERLNRGRLADAKDEERTNRFYEEARIPGAERARLEDYRGSGFDRGHMAPAADMPNSNAMAQSFSLANMVPQAQENNRGVWARRVEATTRQYVKRAQGDVYVFTGPVFSGNVQKIGEGKVWVPSHLYKLVYDPVAQRAWAFWVENTDDAKITRPISYKELVSRVGIEFLPGVSLRE